MEALFTTEDDRLYFCDAATWQRLGWFWLIYGNDGTDVSSDYTANEKTEEIMNAVQPIIDRLEARLYA